MASSFGRWEKDPFFNAAEEVQESADRMESAYRAWIHAADDSFSTWNSDEFPRDLQTAIGTAKWQLEEFERAVRSSYSTSSSEVASPRDRHQDFVAAIKDKIMNVEHLLNKSIHSGGKASLPWGHLDEGEKNELVLFLSGMPAAESSHSTVFNSQDSENPKITHKEISHGHRRAASASAEIGSWKIAVSDGAQQSSSSSGCSGPMPKVPSISGFLSSMESVSKLKGLRNGYRKLKAVDYRKETDNTLHPTAELNKSTNAWYERSNGCVDSCDEIYDKKLYGWYGAIRRQLQRSQYQMQYSLPVRITVWIIVLLCLIVLIAFCAM